MLIIRHRVNQIGELKKTPKEYGVEIDVRAYKKELILNHEPFQKGDNLREYLKNCKHRFIAFNIKEAGIEQKVINLAEKYKVKDYFLLDVEFPFIYQATRNNKFRKIASRFSEAEPIEMSLAQKKYLDWVWVDTNTQLPLNSKFYKQLKDAGFKLCLVCPERWGRPEDIDKYIDYMKQNKMFPDAVMTSLDYAEKWKKF